ncbi:MAG: AAA family ATPase, partial [Hyphomicrobium sp.]
LKRRAEDKNIALVKTPDGYVLAPMHEGKVVRADVFRSLPNGMQREVEDKIASLEGDLKALMAEQPVSEANLGDRLASFARETAVRAVKPHFAAVRPAFAAADGAIAALESAVIACASHDLAASAGARPSFLSDIAVLPVQLAADFTEPAPVVWATDLSVRGLVGEVGHDGAGRLAISPGALMRANGGYLVVEAWRIAAEPAGWACLKSALETSRIAPAVASGLALDIEAVPLSVKLVILADAAGWTRLTAVDPDADRILPHRVAFAERVARTPGSEKAFAGLAAYVAARQDLKALESSAARALFATACRDADSGGLWLDIGRLESLLISADAFAAEDGRDAITASDIAEAVAARRDAHPE